MNPELGSATGTESLTTFSFVEAMVYGDYMRDEDGNRHMEVRLHNLYARTMVRSRSFTLRPPAHLSNSYPVYRRTWRTMRYVEEVLTGSAVNILEILVKLKSLGATSAGRLWDTFQGRNGAQANYISRHFRTILGCARRGIQQESNQCRETAYRECLRAFYRGRCGASEKGEGLCVPMSGTLCGNLNGNLCVCNEAYMHVF